MSLVLGVVMKKIIRLCAIGATTFTLFACGGGSGGSSDNDNNGGGGDNGGGEEPIYQPYACTESLYDQAKNLRIYQIMAESFIDGDSSANHGTGYGTSHHNGDIQGIIDSLDYIKSLGMNGIWITPLFNSQPIEGQDHWTDRLDATGYFASNFFEIDPRFGTLEQARELVETAHAKGLYVFFDGVFGHFKTNADQFSSPLGLSLNNGASGLATYPEDLDFFKEVATYWITELKIDGWRLDQAYQVPLGAWGEIRQAVEEASQQVEYQLAGETVNPMGYMVAEIFNGDPNEVNRLGYGSTDAPGLCSSFDFPLRYKFVQALAVEESGGSNHSASTLAQGFIEFQNVYVEHAVPNAFVTNHDMVRLGDLLQRGGLAEPNESAYWNRIKAVYTGLAAHSGPITLYYGEELGDELEGFAQRVDCSVDGTGAIRGVCDDHVSRTSGNVDGITIDLSSSENAQKNDLKEFVSQLMQLREAHPALYRGENTQLNSSNTDVFIMRKDADNETVVYLANVTENAKTVSISADDVGGVAGLRDLMLDEEIPESGGVYEVNLEPLQSRLLILN